MNKQQTASEQDKRDVGLGVHHVLRMFSYPKINFSVPQHTSLVGLLLLISTFLICNAKNNPLLFLRKH